MIAKLIEWVWPRLQGEPSQYKNFLNENTDISREEDSLENSIKFGILMYEKQKDRIASIEAKSSIYLGFFGTVVAILAFALKDILLEKQNDLAHDLALIFIGVIIVYILQVMRYAIKALERRKYYSFDESNFLHASRRKILINLINTVKSNYDVINEKVDYMTMAHEFTKRILFLLLLAAIALVFLPILKYISLIPNINISEFSLEFNLRFYDYIIGLAIVALIANNYQIRKILKIDKKDANL